MNWYCLSQLPNIFGQRHEKFYISLLPEATSSNGGINTIFLIIAKWNPIFVLINLKYHFPAGKQLYKYILDTLGRSSSAGFGTESSGTAVMLNGSSIEVDVRPFGITTVAYRINVYFITV